MLLFHSNFIKNPSLLKGFQHKLMIIQKWITFYWATPYEKIGNRSIRSELPKIGRAQAFP